MLSVLTPKEFSGLIYLIQFYHFEPKFVNHPQCVCVVQYQESAAAAPLVGGIDVDEIIRGLEDLSLS